MTLSGEKVKLTNTAKYTGKKRDIPNVILSRTVV